MNKHNKSIFKIHLFLAVIFCFMGANPAAAEKAPEHVSIQLPGKSEMNFRAVYLRIDGEALFASRRIKLGSREQQTDSYKEHLTDTLISGSFVGSREGKRDWLYYLGETEVQKRHWNAVMRWADKENGVKQRSENDSRLPQTAVTLAEIYVFIEALNTWILTHEQDRLPKYRRALAFCRLPTEAEWEFAARGGIEVPRNVFDRRYPYIDEHGKEHAGDHEWYRNTSGNRVQECGSSHIKPNPLGLYDMLGNVEELTISLFGPEYQQGRFGQFVIRGGNFSLDEDELSASLRTEYQSHRESNGTLFRPDKVGFRLALSTRITSSGLLSNDFDKAFAEYVKRNGLTHPGPTGESSPSAQAAQDRLQFQEDQHAQLLSDKDILTKEVETLINKQRKSNTKIFTIEAFNKELKAKLSNKEKELENANQQLSALTTTPDGTDLLKGQLKRLREDNKRLLADISKLRRRLDEKSVMVFTDGQSKKELNRKLVLKEQENADLKRQIKQFDHEIKKNAGRVRSVEKRYLEALMRQASANAYIGWRNLKRFEILKKKQPGNRNLDRIFKEGSRMVHDYWNLVVLIADETQADLFPEVKAELADWLRAREKKGDKGWQRKALNLIERHVADVRAGRYHRPENLVRSFTNEPEFK
ncbi:MAG: SUMF1/EgtB/PvdO family nonheme iron enzyme [Desulfobacteraceae bacterium]|nr:SUMF1/EgtB/PvdO family nonheme iron enzyme [Desulfobacteraceae bacterium]